MTATNSIRSIALSALILSQTGPQVERRKHFTKAEIAELAESLKTHGILQPIVARPHGQVVNGPIKEFEIVAGERRYLAAKAAAFTELLVNVRELNDEQCLEVQLIENLQRKDLHPLQEAEGYEQLMKLHGHQVDELGDKVGKSKAYVYGRIKLLALCKEARQAFYDDKLNASTALLLARIPIEKLQKEALKEITADSRYDGPMSYRQAAEHIRDEYMLSLDQAPFPTDDETLCRGAVACGRCPKNTLAQPGLFGDVKGASAGVCTDPTCFKSKREAWAKQRIEKAENSGQRVIDGAAAKKIVPYGLHSLQGGYVKLNDRCYEDPKNRTYRQLLGKDFQPALLRVPERDRDNEGEFIEVADRKDIIPLLKESGVRASRPSSNPEQSAREKKLRAESAYRAALFVQVREASRERNKPLTRTELDRIADRMFDRLDHDAKNRMFKALDWERKKSGMHGGVDLRLPTPIEKLSDVELAQLLRDLLLAPELYVSGYSDARATGLEKTATALGVDPKKIRNELAVADKAKRPVPTKAKKKAARK